MPDALKTCIYCGSDYDPERVSVCAARPERSCEDMKPFDELYGIDLDIMAGMITEPHTFGDGSKGYRIRLANQPDGMMRGFQVRTTGIPGAVVKASIESAISVLRCSMQKAKKAGRV